MSDDSAGQLAAENARLRRQLAEREAQLAGVLMGIDRGQRVLRSLAPQERLATAPARRGAADPEHKRQ
jgi:hypothetical protein